MRTFGLLMVLSAGVAFAGGGVIVQESYSGAYCDQTPHIPQPIMQGIKDLAVRVHPSRPKDQLEAVTKGVCAYLALGRVPDNPGKRAAAADYPFNFPKQLYLAQRPLQN